MSVHVLGIGSPSGGDQAGWLVVDALRALDLDDRVFLKKLDRPGASLVGLLEGAAHVVIVDAMQSGRAPGEVVHLVGQDWASHGGGLSSHGLGVLDALALAQAMGALPAKLEVYGIEIETADPFALPSAAVRAAIARVGQKIAARLLTALKGPRAAA